MKSLPFLPVLLLASAATAVYAEPPPKPPARKEPPSAEQVLKAAAVASGLQIDLWAAEPLLANPVAFTFDNLGRAWVAETNRRKSSYLDIRSFPDWVGASLALTSVEERVAFLKKSLPVGAQTWPKSLRDLNGDSKVDWQDLEVESEILRLVEDKSGSGKADSSKIVSKDFRSVATGIAAGVAVRDGKAFFVCEPDVWIVDESGRKQAIVQGLAVHIVYSGHDCHGAKFGPDGRLYFSIADCSARIESEGKVFAPPSCGAVFRCWPDGTGLELYAFGLRNPQSLAFNDLGDLFTGDNNADGGDKARWVHVVEGADYGWRFHYQFMKEPKLGVWNSEGFWKVDAAGNVPSVLPPVVNIGHGPAGVAYYPGTGLPAEYKGAFFMADFPGGVRAFKLRPKGPSYESELSDTELMDNSPSNLLGKLAWNLNISDVAFGPGGGLYLLDCIDWIPDYNKFDKGRIFRVHSPAADAEPVVEQTRTLLREGFTHRSLAELEALLDHPDQRVRGEAQRALASRGPEALSVFVRTASRPGINRLHAVWGIGELARKNPDAADALRTLLRSGADAEVRAQAAKLLGENGVPSDGDSLASLLQDDAPRVRFFAAQALRRLGAPAQLSAVQQALAKLGHEDAFQRHALSMALGSTAKADQLVALGSSSAASVRLAAVLALRRQQAPGLKVFLKDADPLVRLEAARAIYDQPVPECLVNLAELDPREDEAPGVLQRIQAARYRLGGLANAQRLLTVSTDLHAPAPARVQALALLKDWKPADGRDAFLGRWWPMDPSRETPPVRSLLEPVLPSLLTDKLPGIVDAAVELVGAFELSAHTGALRALFQNTSRSGASRAATLNVLAKLQKEGFGELLHEALKDKNKDLNQAASKLIGKLPTSEALSLSIKLLQAGSVADMQGAVATLAQLKKPEGDAALEAALERLLEGKLPPGVTLDVLEAAAKRATPALKNKLTRFEANRKAEDSLAKWRECLEGGDPKAGATLFKEKDELGCFRCHKSGGMGGDVGPSMDKIAAKHDREYLLRSIVLPNADYAPGFETVLLKLTDGAVAAGMLSKETEATLELTTLGTNEKQLIPKGKIASRERLPSPMPEGLSQLMTKRELRDLVAFLAGQR